MKIADQVIPMASRPDGVISNELGKENVNRFSSALNQALRRGAIVAIRTQRGNRVRYFRSVEQAQDYAQRNFIAFELLQVRGPMAKNMRRVREKLWPELQTNVSEEDGVKITRAVTRPFGRFGEGHPAPFEFGLQRGRVTA